MKMAYIGPWDSNNSHRDYILFLNGLIKRIHGYSEEHPEHGTHVWATGKQVMPRDRNVS